MDQPDDVARFYDALAVDYHLIYGGYRAWEGAVERQAAALDGIVRRHARGPAARLLDATCGIGTQALGLAARGYRVTGCDLSPAAVARAAQEAGRRGLDMDLRPADVRSLAEAVPGEFDVVISCDNSLPHLLTDADLTLALDNMRRKLRPGGLLLVTTATTRRWSPARRC